MTQPQKYFSKTVAETRQSFNKGLTKSPTQRIKFLKNFIQFLKDNEDEIVTTMLQDLRKHREEARLEILIGINHLRYLIDNVRKWVQPEKPPKRWADLLDGLYVHHDPYGVVLVMCAWNVPLLTLLPAAGAIAAGNCVVIKPSHNSPSFGHFLATTLPKYLDRGCFPVVLGGPEQTKQLLEERFDYIYYTGSTAFGRTVHLAANRFLTPTTLEMGGKNPVYIDASADLELAAVRIMWGKCFNSGQACIAPDYVMCPKFLQQDFIQHARNAIERFYNSTHFCPIVNDHHFKRLTRLLQGLTVATGGRTDPLENLIEPTIVVDVPPKHPVMQEEIFGPILPIITVRDHKEAVRFINEREKPLALYIFAEDMTIKDYFVENTSCGGVTVNDTLMHLVVEELPFGGVGLSGMGRYKGKDSFYTFSHRKSVLVKNSWRIVERINELRYPPYSGRKSDVVAFLLRYRSGLPWIWMAYAFVFLFGVFIGFLLYYVSMGIFGK